MTERHTTFRFTLEPSASQADALRRHVGAARFAFNPCLRIVRDALTAKKEAPEKQAPDSKVPWSGFDLINTFNRWKLTSAAGVDEQGTVGLPWRDTISQQVFEEAAVDLGRALAAFTAGRKGERQGRPPRFPRPKKKSTARPSFRMRNKGKGERAAIRLGAGSARTVRRPTLGALRVRECTRNLRRMLRTDRAKILFATVSFRGDGRWRVTLNVEAKPLHPGRRHSAMAHRFYPSTRRCSACWVVGPKLDLSERVFHCHECGHEADRDTNAATSLAQYPEAFASGWSHVAAKHAETQNVCGEDSSDARRSAERETGLNEAERTSVRRPRRAVLAAKTVNTL